MHRRLASRGFTLIELMTVVIVVGILATLATFGVVKYVRSAKMAEGLSMVGSIQAAEESYRDETFVYAGLNDFTAWHPVATPGAFKANWMVSTPSGATTVLRELGVHTDNPVYFTYSVVARRAGEGTPTLPTSKSWADFGLPSSPAEPFYVAVAKGDLDGDGTFSYVLGHSFAGGLYVERDGE